MPCRMGTLPPPCVAVAQSGVVVVGVAAGHNCRSGGMAQENRRRRRPCGADVDSLFISEHLRAENRFRACRPSGLNPAALETPARKMRYPRCLAVFAGGFRADVVGRAGEPFQNRCQRSGDCPFRPACRFRRFHHSTDFRPPCGLIWRRHCICRQGGEGCQCLESRSDCVHRRYSQPPHLRATAFCEGAFRT